MPDELPGADALIRSEEQLVVGVERVPYERVVLRRRVVTETVTTVTQVRREELVVEREPLHGGSPAADAAPDGDAGDLELVLREEQVVTTTRVVPYERVRVRRTSSTSDVDVDETVRREEIELL